MQRGVKFMLRTLKTHHKYNPCTLVSWFQMACGIHTKLGAINTKSSGTNLATWAWLSVWQGIKVLPTADHLCSDVSWFHTRRYASGTSATWPLVPPANPQVAQVLPGQWPPGLGWDPAAHPQLAPAPTDTSVTRIPTEGLCCVNSCRSLSTTACLGYPTKPCKHLGYPTRSNATL